MHGAGGLDSSADLPRDASWHMQASDEFITSKTALRFQQYAKVLTQANIYSVATQGSGVLGKKRKATSLV